MELDRALDQLAQEARQRAAEPAASPEPQPPLDRLQSALDELVSDATQLAVTRELVDRKDARLLRTRTPTPPPESFELPHQPVTAPTPKP